MFKPTKSVDQIVQTFTKTIEELKAAADSNIALASYKAAQAQELLRKAEEHKTEAAKATAVAAKLNTIFN